MVHSDKTRKSARHKILFPSALCTLKSDLKKTRQKEQLRPLIKLSCPLNVGSLWHNLLQRHLPGFETRLNRLKKKKKRYRKQLKQFELTGEECRGWTGGVWYRPALIHRNDKIDCMPWNYSQCREYAHFLMRQDLFLKSTF